MSLLTDDRVRLLSECVAAEATQHILFDRDDSDSFQIRLESIRPDTIQVTREQVAPALPVGSQWADAIGWESYVALEVPLRSRDSYWRGHSDLAIVGLEYVLPHLTRTAYPVFAGAVVKVRAVADVLRAIALGLDPNVEPAGRVVVTSDARCPEEHRACAAAVLRASAGRFEAGKRPLVRTAVLSEDEVPPRRTILMGGVALGIVPALLPRLSFTRRMLLK